MGRGSGTSTSCASCLLTPLPAEKDAIVLYICILLHPPPHESAASKQRATSKHFTSMFCNYSAITHTTPAPAASLVAYIPYTWPFPMPSMSPNLTGGGCGLGVCPAELARFRAIFGENRPKTGPKRPHHRKQSRHHRTGLLFSCQGTPPPHCESNALVRATVGVVSATFGPMSYFALYQHPPLSEQQSVLSPQFSEPCPTLPFINTPPCQSNSRCCFRHILGF